MKYVLIAVILSPVYSQYVDMKPDVTFDDHNDRFDIAPIVDQQNRVYSQAELRELEEYRRSGADINQLAEALRESVRRNKDFSEFAYHDRMESDKEDEDYERSLNRFKSNRRLQGLVEILHGQKRGRRSGLSAPESGMFHYAVPVDMKINGYFQMPLVE